jgi:hypothetical protein
MCVSGPGVRWHGDHDRGSTVVSKTHPGGGEATMMMMMTMIMMMMMITLMMMVMKIMGLGGHSSRRVMEVGSPEDMTQGDKRNRRFILAVIMLASITSLQVR